MVLVMVMGKEGFEVRIGQVEDFLPGMRVEALARRMHVLV